MKKVLYGILGVLVLLFAGGAFAISRIDTASFTQKIAELTRDATGKPLVLSQAPSISIMPLGVSFGPSTWGMQDGKAVAQGISVSIQSGTVSMQLMPLLSGKIVVDKVVLNSPAVTVRPEALPADAAPKAAQRQAKAEAPTIPPVELASLRITNGSVDMDMGQGQNMRLNALNLSLNNLVPNKDATCQLSAQVDVTQKGATLVAGKVTQKGQLRLASDQVDFKGVEVTFTPEKGRIPASLGPVRLNVSASFALASQVLTLNSLKVSAAHTDIALNGVVHLDPLSFKGTQSVNCAPDKMMQALGMAAPLPHMPQAFSLKTPVTFANNVLDIPEYTANIDKSTITGSLHVTLPQGKQPLIIKKVTRIDHLNLDQYLGTAASEKKQDAKPDKSAASASSTLPFDAASLPTVDSDVIIKSLTVRKIPIENLHVTLKGTAGRYTFNPASFTLGTGGSVQTSSVIDLAALRYSSQGKAAQVNVGALLQAMQGKSPVSGNAQLDYDLACAGLSAAAVKSSLSGKGMLLVQNIVLKDVKLLPKDSPQAGQQPTNFERLQVPFTAKNGMVNLAPISLTSPSVNAKGQGVVNLPQSTLNMSADIAMLGVTVPVVASGPFSNLSYGLDPVKVLKGVLNTPGTAVKGAGNILQQGGKGAQGVGGAIKGLFGK